MLNVQNRGFETVISPGTDKDGAFVNCAFCGQCTVVCPVGAFKETSSADIVLVGDSRSFKESGGSSCARDKGAIGEEFGLPAGTRCSGKLASANSCPERRHRATERVAELEFKGFPAKYYSNRGVQNLLMTTS